MKKLWSLLAAVALVFTLAACTEKVVDEGGEIAPVEEEVIVEEVEEGKLVVNGEFGTIEFLTEENIAGLGSGDVIKVTYYEDGNEFVSYEMVQKYIEPSLDYSVSEILNKIIENSNVELWGMEDKITADNIQWLLGSTDYPEFLDSAVYYPMMGVDVSMLVVLEVNEEDVELTKEAIMNNIDPNRLVCVTFDLEEDVIVDSFGNKVVLVINKAYKTELHDAFLGLVDEAKAGHQTVEGTVVETVVVEEGTLTIETENGLVDFVTDADLSEIGIGDVITVTYNKADLEFVSYELVEKYTAPSFDLSASEIIQHLVNQSGAEFGGSMEDVITDDNRQWYLGAGDYPEFIDSAVYTPMMNVDVSLIVVLKVELEEVETLKETILDSIDPHRLICVSFDLEEDVVIDSYGDTVVLIINKMYTEEIHDAFVALQ